MRPGSRTVRWEEMQSIYVFISGALPSFSRACEGEMEEREKEGEEEEE